MRALLLLLVALSTPAWGAPMLAIADLQNHTGQADLDGAGAGVAGVLTSKLARVDAVGVVERSRLTALTDEIQLGASGLVDPSSAAKAGKLLGADYMVFGSIFSVKLPSISVTLWVVDVESGQVIASEEVRGEIGDTGDEFFVLIDELAFRLLDAMKVSLPARDRIALGQVDVRELRTVEVYGKALDALDAGDIGSAEQLLSTALTLEPQFHLAEETLQHLSAMIASRKAAFASKELDEARAALVALQADLDARRGQQAEPVEHLVDLALQERLSLIRGELDDYFKLSEEHARVAKAFVEAGTPAPEVVGHRGQSWYPDSMAQGVVTKRLDALGVRAWSSSLFGDIAVWPWEVAYQQADVLLLLGRRDEAIALVLQTYQHPGPVGSSGPRSPDEWLDRRHIAEPRVVFAQQTLKAAELLRDVNAEKRALYELEKVVGEATRAKEARAAYDKVMVSLGDRRRDRTTIGQETRVVTDALVADGRALVEYRAFLRRADQGVYEGVEHFDELAKRWRDVMRTLYRASWYPEQNLDLLLTFQRLVPPGDAERAEYYRRDVEDLIRQGLRR